MKISKQQLQFSFDDKKYFRLPFLEFASGEYPDKEYGEDQYQLYVVRKNTQVLYVGISESNIWNRWFNGGRGHVLINIYGEMIGRSSVGNSVVNEPHLCSIELWTLSECIEYCRSTTSFKINRYDIKDIEPIMIHKLKPKLNVIFNTNYSMTV